MRDIASTSQEQQQAEYEITSVAASRLSLTWLIIIAIIIWGGAWWLGQTKEAPPSSQGETATQTH